VAKNKFYAVRLGRTPGIYSTWTQTEEQVKGFSGAVYKAFSTEEEAVRYISCEEIKENEKVSDGTAVINNKIEQEINNLQDGEVIAFVDGSYSQDSDGKEKYSFGVILITKESECNLYKAFVGKTNMEARNIAGEIEGVKQAVLWAIDNNKQRIKIFYDYEGIEKWATKEWNANAKVSQEYSRFVDEKSKMINIEFEYVKAHNGIIYNEKADELAKRALLAHGYKTHNDGSIYFIGLQKQDWLDVVESLNDEISKENIEDRIIVNESSPKKYLNKLVFIFDEQRVTINCYTGKKSYVQGKQSILFQKIISLAIEKLPTDNAVIEVLNTYHALTVKEAEVENAFSTILPDFPANHHDSKLRNTLLSAVFNTLITGYMPDYTCLVTPMFRVMEFYLHRILKDKLGKPTTNGNDKNNFAYFNINAITNNYEYNSSTGSLNSEQINFLNELYNRYNRMRHPYSHWAESSTDTQVITDIKTAHELILDGLRFVNKYYTIF
jgi:caulimovirus viroplasmin